MKPEKLLEVRADLHLKNGSETIELKQDEEVLIISLSSFRSLKSLPLSKWKGFYMLREASRFLSNPLQIDLQGKVILSLYRGKLRLISPWLAFRALIA